MHARIATFESDAANVDDAIGMVRAEVESGNTPAGLEGAKMLMLVNRETSGGTERRTSVEYEMPVQTVS
jgi:hypothetical protein